MQKIHSQKHHRLFQMKRELEDVNKTAKWIRGTNDDNPPKKSPKPEMKSVRENTEMSTKLSNGYGQSPVEIYKDDRGKVQSRRGHTNHQNSHQNRIWDTRRVSTTWKASEVKICCKKINLIKCSLLTICLPFPRWKGGGKLLILDFILTNRQLDSY